MKKVLLSIVGIMCSLGMWAQTTIGLTQAIDGTTKTVAAAAYTGGTNLTVAEAHGAGCGIKQKSLVTQCASGFTGKGNGYTAAETFRKTVNSTTWDATEWIGFTVTVAKGYKADLTNLKAMLCDANSGATYTWRLVIENASGTALYTSESTTTAGYNYNSMAVSAPTKVTGLAAGTYTVKLQLYQSGGNKYITVPYLTVDATLAQDASISYDVATSVSPENSGTVAGGGSWTEGSDVSLTATPATGYKFVNWTIDNATKTDNPYTISSIAANHTVVANFEALPKITFAIGEGSGVAPSVAYAEKDSKLALPAADAQLIYKDGYTMTGWSDGTNTYGVDDEVTVTGDMTFTAQFAANEVALGDAETTVNWTFATKDGAPAMALEGKEGYYAKKVTIDGKSLDVIMKINTTKGAAGTGYESTTGKCNTTGADNRAQVNGGTVFTIPAIAGMTVTYTATNGTPNTTSATFAGEVGEVDGSSLVYTYNGSASTIDIIDCGSSLYPSGISVVYPVAAVTPVSNDVTLYDWSSTGTTTLVGDNVEEGTVKLYKSTIGTDGIAFSSSMYSGTTLTNYIKIAPKEGAFVKGDVLHVKVAFSNSDETKLAKVDLRDYKENLLWTSEQGVNGKTSDDDPVDQTFTLTDNTPYLYLGRNGNTKTFIISLSVIGDKTVDHAVTILPTYAISAVTADESMGTVTIVNGGKYIDKGTSVKVTATANTGYDFVSWTDANNNVVSTSAEFTFVASADSALTANFEAHQYLVKFIADGNPYASVNVLYGESINSNLQAPDKEGYTFKGWDPEIPAAIVEDMTFNAVYEVNKYNLTFIVDGQETTSQVAYGSAITAPTPSKEGYTFTGWSPALAEGATMPASDVTYTAQFSKDIVASDLALAETTADVEINGTTTVKYTTSSTGTVSVSSSSENATVSVDESAKTITITGVKAGEATITVSQAADNNYSASEEKTITVTVNAPTDVARTTTAGKFGTICLPYKFKADGAKVYSVELNNAENALTLNEVSTIEAGKAYLYQSTDASQTFSYDNGDKVSEPVSSLPLVGVFEDTTAPTGSYVLQTQDGVQQFYIVKSSDITVPANKAYVKTSTTSSSAKSITIRFAGEDATGINALNALVSNNAKIYDINGRQLNSLKKGVNIVNGTKVVVK